MPYKRLWVLVEGNDEERFFDAIKHTLENKYDFVQMWQYAQQPPKRIKNFLNSIRAMNSDYFVLKDINRSPCVTAKKNSIKTKYGTIIDANSLIIVVKAIESWYLAGLDTNTCKKLRIKAVGKTDDITKEQFDRLIPKKFDSRIDFMVEILKRFSVKTARRKNKSFSYFMTKLGELG
ncbi:MAG: hypothetical protein AMJ75_09950 [Phycisphaerae bacterium SM1_79]|nr:MAG: hypothetical protein AMJ75_09950 [Phycisphaerae bacterium SM1_79]